MIPVDLEVLPPWSVLTADRAELLTARLRTVLPEGHALYRVKLRAVAARIDCDDVLFEIENSSMRLAVVHMTWRAESDPTWPKTSLFRDWPQWATLDMHPSHHNFAR